MSYCPEDCINKSCEFENGSCTYGINRKHDEPRSDKDEGKNSMVSVIVGIGVAVIVLCLVGVIIFRKKIHTRRRSDGTSRHSAGQRKETTDQETLANLLKGPDTALSNNELKLPPSTGREKLLEFIKRLQTKTETDYQDEFSLLLCDDWTSRRKTDSTKGCQKQDNAPICQNFITIKMDSGENVSLNASFIKTRNSSNSVYIACKGPTNDVAGGFDRFWMMLWQLDCKAVVMLNTLDTLNVAEAELNEYWPIKDRPEYYGQLFVKQEPYEKNEVYISRTFTVKMGEETKTITHLQYKEWPEKGCAANVHNLLTFLKIVRKTSQADSGSNKSSLVVHGSSGEGRTGTYIALDMLVQEAEDMVNSTDEAELDVFTCVKHIRAQRNNLIENVEQYKFLHYALVCYITEMLKT